MKTSMVLIYCLVLPMFIYGQVYSTNTGTLSFVSEAPLELIKATSKELQGALDLEKKTFAFKLYIKSFKGFNSPLQQEHFFENYMEVDAFPQAIFKGKILENINNGIGSYRAKGSLSIHGVTKEVIIDVVLNVSSGMIAFEASFKVPLEDHDIELPRIVYQKIAEVIDVKAKGQLELRQ